MELLPVDEDKFNKVSAGEIIKFLDEEGDYLCHCLVLSKRVKGESFFVDVLRFRIEENIMQNSKVTEFMNFLKGIGEYDRKKLLEEILAIEDWDIEGTSS